MGSSQVYKNRHQYQKSLDILFVEKKRLRGTHAREGTVVPEVALVGEAVTNVTELALLDVLLDGVEELLLGDLDRVISTHVRGRKISRYPCIVHGGVIAAIASGQSVPPAWRWSSEGSRQSC